MYKLILIFALFISSILIAQSKYETDMQNALIALEKAETTSEYDKSAKEFERISRAEKDNWLPFYYMIFAKTLSGFTLNKNAAIKQSNELEELYSEMEKLNPDQSEALTLRALFRTIKVAKDPMTYGMSLSSAIIKDYDDALKLNELNPRALYLMAQFNMESAEYWGRNRKDYCPQIERAKSIYVFEKPNSIQFSPKWGEKQVDEIINETCLN